jgi:hypothetical protein
MADTSSPNKLGGKFAESSDDQLKESLHFAEVDLIHVFIPSLLTPAVLEKEAS